jgi:NAD(P)-dependent dehydrogenase (short-subunit alcohol dehydrogenase family)
MSVWVITGANRGLGLEFVNQLSGTKSNTIIGATRSLSSDLTALENLKTKNGNIHILECDTSSIPSIERFAKDIAGILGPDQKISYLLNNAGINSVPHEKALSMSLAGITEQITTNVLGPAKTVELLSSHLGKGTVVMNMTSGLGSIATAQKGTVTKGTTYSISKAALNMLTVHQSVELKSRGVVVICMDPGWVKTRMGGKGAQMEQHDSISSMLKVLGGLKESDTGKYYQYSGEEMPW